MRNLSLFDVRGEKGNEVVRVVQTVPQLFPEVFSGINLQKLERKFQ